MPSLLKHFNPRRFAFGERLLRWCANAEDHWFEKRHGLELGQIVAHDDLVSSHRGALVHATAYQGVWCRNVRTLLAQARGCSPLLRQFVDLGSGKGKACFMAAASRRFDCIRGVEFSQPLVDVARHNQTLLPAADVEFLCADAAEYKLPDAPSLVFMFNPFDGVILERFLALNGAHFRKHGSLVAYAKDMQRHVLRKCGFDTLYRNPVRGISLFCKT
jgi:SAM-dependent methyltransferase